MTATTCPSCGGPTEPQTAGHDRLNEHPGIPVQLCVPCDIVLFPPTPPATDDQPPAALHALPALPERRDLA